MTLLIAAACDAQLWMIADTAITGGNIPLREKCFSPKIFPVQNEAGLIGFAGDAESGPILIAKASKATIGQETIEILLKSHQEYPSVDFCYGYIEDSQVHLIKISNASAIEVSTLYLGDHDAFKQFQEIRHSPEISHAPNSMHTLMYGPRTDSEIPKALKESISGMVQLLTGGHLQTVGGWATPYLLDQHGTQLLSCVYDVTDPIISQLKVSSLIPHGTASGGGYSFSICETIERDGMVIYSPQLYGGYVYILENGVYKQYRFNGSPPEFIAAVKKDIGRTVETWFGGTLDVLNSEVAQDFIDQDGRKRISAIKNTDNNTFSLAWQHNSQDSFKISGRIDFKPSKKEF